MPFDGAPPVLVFKFFILIIEMALGQIKLNPVLDDRDYELIAKWLIDPRSLTTGEWLKALTVFDHLKLSKIEWKGQWQNFAEFYELVIENDYANVFIDELITVSSLESVGYRKLADYAQRIKQRLKELLAGRSILLQERALISYCLYWWNAFGKGYIFELMVFSDLTRAGIQFNAHDLRSRDERYSWYDLAIMQWRGDIKTSAYFLHVVRSFPLRHDFYITRLYVAATHTWQLVVLLTPVMWTRIDGETQATVLQEAVSFFPRVVEVQIREVKLIVLDYSLWKEKIIKQQTGSGESP